MDSSYQKQMNYISKAVPGGSDLMIAKNMAMIATQIFNVSCKITYIRNYRHKCCSYCIAIVSYW